MSILIDNSLVLEGELCEDNTSFVGLFPRGHVSIVAGEPGIGKTWFMLDFARSLVDGGFLAGDFAHRYSQGKALIFAGETGVRLLGSRLSMLGGCNHPENMRIISLHVCAMRDVNVMINTAIGRKNVNEAIKEYRPDIVFFDTMISFMSDGKDESSQVDMLDTLRGLTFIAAENKCALVVMHHFRKKQQGVVGARTMDDVIGTSAFTRLASLVVGVFRKEELRYVKCLKSWWKEFDTFAFIIKSAGKGVEIVRDYTFGETGRELSKVTNVVIHRLMEEYATGELFTALDAAALCDVSRPTATEALAQMVRGGHAEVACKDGNTRKYRIIPQVKETGVNKGV